MDFKRFFVILILFFTCFSIFSFPFFKSEKKKPTFTASTELGWQMLSWEEEDPDFVSKYKVIIDVYNKKTGSWLSQREFETEDSSTSVKLEPILPPGRYRYKIVTFDLLDREAVESDWGEFNIYEAHQPEITGISSVVNGGSTIYLEEFNDGKFEISGRNFFPTRENASGMAFSDYSLVQTEKRNPKTFFPEITRIDSEKNRSLDVTFDMDELDVGVYNFIVKDASGLSTENQEKNNTITVKYKKRVDLDISLGLACPYILYDDTFDTYMGSRIWPKSANAKIDFMFIKHNWGYLGIGICGTYTRMEYEADVFSIDGNLMTAHALLVYQFPIRFRVKGTNQRKHRFTLEVHGGAGGTYFNNYVFHFSKGIDSDPLNSVNKSAIVGGAVQTYITTRIFAEVQIDFITAFVSDMSYGMVVPCLNIGVQL